MADHPEVLFADRVHALRVPRDEPGRQLNACLAEAAQACGDIAFDGTVVRIELYHLRHPEVGTRVDWHRHPFTELTWVEGGPITYEHGDRAIALADGEHFVMPAFTPHAWHGSAANTALHGFMLTVLPATRRRHSLLPHLSAAASDLGYRLPRDAEAAAAFGQAEAEAIRGDALGIEAAAGYLRAGLARLFRHITAAAAVGESPPPAAGQPVALERAAGFIAAHLAEPLDVTAVADHVQLSTRQLDRLFHAAFDMPTGAFLLHARLERARYLLGDSDLSIKQIARASGFADPNYFSRIFRQRHGQSPGTYRRQRQG